MTRAASRSGAGERTYRGPSLIAGILALVVLIAVSADVKYNGAFTRLDHRVAGRSAGWDLRDKTAARWSITPLLYFGQRGTALVGATLALGWIGWRQRTVEPILRLVVAVIALLVVVYAFKLGLARNAPIQDLQGVPAGHGASYPSGHTANAVLLWGLLDWAVRRWAAPPRVQTLVRVGRWVAPVAVVVGMTLLNYHYLSDFAGGAAVGVLLLAFALLPLWGDLSVRVDRRFAGPRSRTV